jgi:hypothetical protein
MCDGVLFVERAGELPSLARLSHLQAEPQRKRVRKGDPSNGVLEGVDPKLCELLMARVKPA